MATATNPFPLATEQPYSGPGDAGGGGAVNNDAGASGASPNAMTLSPGAMIAIIVVVVVVGVVGIATAALFFVAKKREWTVRETLRRSTRKVVTALTPRRSEFPRSVKESNGASRPRGRVRLDDVPPTPKLRPEDLEKGFRREKRANFSRK